MAVVMEQWCTDNASNCLVSDPFQSESYDRQSWDGGGANFLGVDVQEPGAKPGSNNLLGEEDSSIGVGGNNTFATTLAISTDSAILNLLPSRDTSKVARFLRHGADNLGGNQSGTYRFGHMTIPLGTTVKRMAMRWYSYYSSDFQWANQGSCTNGKIAHIAQTAWGTSPFVTLTVHGSSTSMYTFQSDLGWTWDGHSGWGGFDSGKAPRPGSGVDVTTWRGKWFRHEIVVSNPREADATASGFDYSYFVKNVTNGTSEVEDQRLTGTCTSCFHEPIAGGAIDYNGSSGNIYPSEDIRGLHTEFYRAGTCNGWLGWLYLAMATWTTDAGQRIGAASEVEGGGGGGGGGLALYESDYSILQPQTNPLTVSRW
jgi:hypothetical protein